MIKSFLPKPGRVVLSLFLLATCLLFVRMLAAETVCEMQCAERAQFVSQILASHPFYMSRATKTGSHATFCTTFFTDLKANRGIEYLESVLRTDDLNHPGLRSYRQCLKYEHATDVDPDIRYYDLPQLGDRNFEVFALEQYKAGRLNLCRVGLESSNSETHPRLLGHQPSKLHSRRLCANSARRKPYAQW